jgi:rhamnogalacturonan acetylesterase
MRKSIFKSILLATLMLLCVAAIPKSDKRPTLFLIGDSTVDHGKGGNGLWGWGKFLPQFFDTTKVVIKNYAVGGTSTRTFQTNGIWNPKLNSRGMWDTVYSKLQKGDYLIIQFGLNDQSAVNDSTRSRGTLNGIGIDSVVIVNGLTHKQETVHSFGWYLRRFIVQAKSKGATVIVCSSVPRNKWIEDKLIRNENGFPSWAMEVAKAEDVASIDLNTLIANEYDKEGRVAVTEKYHISKDDTHTVEAGAILNASIVASSIAKMKNCGLSKFVIKK